MDLKTPKQLVQVLRRGGCLAGNFTPVFKGAFTDEARLETTLPSFLGWLAEPTLPESRRMLGASVSGMVIIAQQFRALLDWDKHIQPFEHWLATQLISLVPDQAQANPASGPQVLQPSHALSVTRSWLVSVHSSPGNRDGHAPLPELRSAALNLSLNVLARRLQLAILPFLLNHSGLVGHDPRADVRALMHNALSHRWQDAAVMLQAMEVCIRLAQQLQRWPGPTLPDFLPLFLKAAAWNPHVLGEALLSLLPALISFDSLAIAWQHLLCLPHLLLALSILPEYHNTASFPYPDAPGARKPRRGSWTGSGKAGGSPDGVLMSFLHSMAAQHEQSGLFDPPWQNSEGMQALTSAMQAALPSPRMPFLCGYLAPRVLEVFLAAVLQKAPDAAMLSLLASLLSPRCACYPEPHLQAAVAALTSDEAELVGCVLYVVGEHAGGQGTSKWPSKHAQEHSDAGAEQMSAALEAVLYAWLAETSTSAMPSDDVELQAQQVQHSDQLPAEPDRQAKLVCMALTALTKIAIRHRSLVPRTLVCLRKFMTASHAGPTIKQRAEEGCSFLQDASAIRALAAGFGAQQQAAPPNRTR
ncbi:hypothetical protein WJX72_008505 [[Myrmecia] bisecta]|uniref:Uncharacterized protein n=1 Tax=[Myrmecia] bisecta TaxID=41462 RepID=A0AAW1R7U5_9CHLO